MNTVTQDQLAPISRRKFLLNSSLGLGGTLLMSHSLAACAKTQSNTKSDPQVHQVEIKAFTYSSKVLSVQISDIVTWVNNDTVPHTATANDKSWNTGLIMPGEAKSITVTKGMQQGYFCEYHPMMVATLRFDSQ